MDLFYLNFAVYKRWLNFSAYKSRKTAVRTAPNLRRFKLENALTAIGKHKVLEILDRFMVMTRILSLP